MSLTLESLKQLMHEQPDEAVSKVGFIVGCCSGSLKELHDDPDLTESDWLCSEGAILEESEEDEEDRDSRYDVMLPEVEGMPSVELRIGEFFHYLPLPYAIHLVAGHFEVEAELGLEFQDLLCRGATEYADELWGYFDESIAELKVLVDSHLPRLVATKDCVYKGLSLKLPQK